MPVKDISTKISILRKSIHRSGSAKEKNVCNKYPLETTVGIKMHLLREIYLEFVILFSLVTFASCGQKQLKQMWSPEDKNLIEAEIYRLFFSKPINWERQRVNPKNDAKWVAHH